MQDSGGLRANTLPTMERERSENSLKIEAERVIETLGLLDSLRPYGEARVVGSVALDMVVKRDIDIHVLTKTPKLIETAGHVHNLLLSKSGVSGVHVTDYSGRGGVKVGVERYPGPSGDWSIDIWLTNHRESTGFDLVDRLAKALTPEQRAAILRIKRHYHKRGLLCDGISASIYDAVIKRGARTIGDFHRILSQGL